jgi:purine-binding chemotaxis protein CheW
MLHRLVQFALDGQDYAVPLARVQQALRMAEATPLPDAPEVVLGVLDLKGVVLPVLSMRKRFGVAEKDASLSDQLLIADIATHRIAIVVSSVNGVVERTTEEIIAAKKIAPGSRFIEGITRLNDGLLFIYDLDQFLSPGENRQLQNLLAQEKSKE